MQLAGIVFLMLMISTQAFSINTEIFNCSVSNPDWNSTFVLDAVGTGFLKIKKAGHKALYTCKLKVAYIHDGQRDEVPNITIEFKQEACNFEFKAIQQDLFDNFTLIVSLIKKDDPKGHVQWLRKKQPDLCVVKKLSLFDITLNAKKWLEGTWGTKQGL